MLYFQHLNIFCAVNEPDVPPMMTMYGFIRVQVFNVLCYTETIADNLEFDFVIRTTSTHFWLGWRKSEMEN